MITDSQMAYIHTLTVCPKCKTDSIHIVMTEILKETGDIILSCLLCGQDIYVNPDGKAV